MPRPAIPFADRFFKNIKIEGDCVVWTASRNKTGYGSMGIGGRKTALAHRVSWFLKYGKWPEGELRHSCDNPACVRIKHLSEGTSQQNSDDMVERGRQAWGERSANSKLTIDQVREIRDLGGRDILRRNIADHYGISVSSANWIVQRRTWRPLDPEEPSTPRKGGPIPCQFEVEGEQLTVAEMARWAGVSVPAIKDRINRGLTGRDLIARNHAAKRKPYTRG